MDIFLLAAIILVGIALFFAFSNGFHGSANQVAPVIVSGAMSPKKALLIAALGNFIGAYFLGTAVAETIGRGIVDPNLIQIGTYGAKVIFAALLGATIWNVATWYFRMPSSSSHALIGGLIGAFVSGWGFESINWYGVGIIIAIMLISPIIGFCASWMFTRLIFRITNFMMPKTNKFVFKNLQFFSLLGQSMSHGTNDAQKTMGVITLSLIILGLYAIPPGERMIVPQWAVFLSSVVMAAGTIMGGWRIMKTLGTGLYKIRLTHAFSSQIVSGLIIFIAGLFGFPISTTQVMSASVIGAGAATRANIIRWLVAKDMIISWLITIPTSAFIAASALFAIKFAS